MRKGRGGVGLWLGLFAGLAIAAGSAALGRVLRSMRIRMDASGDGSYGADRGDHMHEGLDLLARPGEAVLSPLDGVYVGPGQPYPGDDRFDLLRLDGEGFEVLLMYVQPLSTLRPGSRVQRGQVVGVAQNIVQRYGAPMLAHIHVEVRTKADGALANPELLLPLDPLA